jgi:hypothetical protein
MTTIELKACDLIIQPKQPWHRPRITVVETTGPLRCCAFFTLLDGRRILVPGTWKMTNEFNGAPLIATLREIFGSGRTARSITSRQVGKAAAKQKAAGQDSLWLALGGKYSDPIVCLDSRYISVKLKEIEGRDFGGHCLERDHEASTTFHNAAVWYIRERLSDKS